MFWSVQAATDPSNWVFHMGHGDVLITKSTPAKKPMDERASAPVASVKTLRTLATPSVAPAARTDAVEDPMMLNDPWMPARPQAKVSPSQIASIEATVEQRVKASLTKIKDMEVDDGPERIKELENKVAALQDGMNHINGTVQQVQTQQQQMSNQFATQLQTIQMQVDQGHANMQSMVDNKLSEQMERIELLLEKRDKRAKLGPAPMAGAGE